MSPTAEARAGGHTAPPGGSSGHRIRFQGRGSFSPHRPVNRALSWTMGPIGTSSYVWRTTHNTTHHTCTNISSADPDIDPGPRPALASHTRRPRRMGEE